MSSTSSDLFRYRSTRESLESHRSMTARRIQEINDRAKLSQEADDLVARAAFAKCTLLRERAEFKVSENGLVTVTVPISGNVRLLSVRPTGRTGTGPYATVNDGMMDSRGPRVSFEKSFPAGTPAEDVRAWAKATVDEVEATLALSDAEIDEFNSTVEADTRALIAARDAMLDTATSLREGLADGGI